MHPRQDFDCDFRGVQSSPRLSLELRMRGVLATHDVTQLLAQWADGDERALEDLTPLVYKELRRLAASHLRKERKSHTLQPTALVHEAYLRLVVSDDPSAPREQQWNSRGHFFAAAAEAMRRILIETAGRRSQ